MIDEESPFLRSAAVTPDDDTLRLVYADWLDERGEEKLSTHAAFVRLQVRRSRLDVFDPMWRSLLTEEATHLSKYKRDWNGRIHHALHRKGLRGLIDVRRGAIREWRYHRGMIAQVSVTVNGLAEHSDLIFSLGPVESLRLGWPTDSWSPAANALQRFLPRLKVLKLTGQWWNVPPLDLSQLGPLGLIPLLDLRSINCNPIENQLPALARSGAIPPVVLFRRSIRTMQPYTYQGRQYTQAVSREADHVIDPFKQWDSLRLWYSDFVGEVLTPVRYQSTSR